MTGDLDGLEIEIIASRRALIQVIAGLADQSEALTVLGGHAVIEVTQDVPALPPDDTTRDGDLGVIPQLLNDDPNLSARMTELGYETARPERPGVWSPISQRDRDIHSRDSVDVGITAEASRRWGSCWGRYPEWIIGLDAEGSPRDGGSGVAGCG